VVLPAQFRHEQLDRDEVWELIRKTQCRQVDDFDSPWTQRVTIDFRDEKPTLVKIVKAPKGIDPAMSNEEILQKWRLAMETVIDLERRKKIEDLVLNMQTVENIVDLGQLMAGATANPIA
jgi:aconitate decarboxylase